MKAITAIFATCSFSQLIKTSLTIVLASFLAQTSLAANHTITLNDNMTLIVTPKTQIVDDGDTVTWTIGNAAAHSVDTAIRYASTLRITFTGNNPTTGAAIVTAPIDPPGGNDTNITVTLKNPLADGTYPYDVEILDQFGNKMVEIDPYLVKYSSSVPTLTEWGFILMFILLIATGWRLSNRKAAVPRSR